MLSQVVCDDSCFPKQFICLDAVYLKASKGHSQIHAAHSAKNDSAVHFVEIWHQITFKLFYNSIHILASFQGFQGTEQLFGRSHP